MTHLKKNVTEEKQTPLEETSSQKSSHFSRHAIDSSKEKPSAGIRKDIENLSAKHLNAEMAREDESGKKGLLERFKGGVEKVAEKLNFSFFEDETANVSLKKILIGVGAAIAGAASVGAAGFLLGYLNGGMHVAETGAAIGVAIGAVTGAATGREVGIVVFGSICALMGGAGGYILSIAGPPETRAIWTIVGAVWSGIAGVIGRDMPPPEDGG